VLHRPIETAPFFGMSDPPLHLPSFLACYFRIGDKNEAAGAAIAAAVAG